MPDFLKFKPTCAAPSRFTSICLFSFSTMKKLLVHRYRDIVKRNFKQIVLFLKLKMFNEERRKGHKKNCSLKIL